MWTFKKYFHKHLDAWRLLFGPFHWMRFFHMPVWKPETKWRREKQEDGIIEKDSQKVKDRRKTSSTRDREADRLKCKYSQKKEREIDIGGYRIHAIYLSIGLCTVLFFLSHVFYFPSEFLRGLVWSIIVFFSVSHDISFGVEYTNTWVKFTENEDRHRPAFNT